MFASTFLHIHHLLCCVLTDHLLMPSATKIEKFIPQDLKRRMAFSVYKGINMWRLGLTPDWFREIDTGFEIVSIIVTFLIAVSAYKFYKLTNEKTYKWFSLSFFAMSLAYIFKILTNIVVYNEEWIGKEILGKYTMTYQYVHEYYYFEIFGTIAFRFLMLVGLFGLYYIICKCKDKKTIPIMLFLLFFTTMFSNVQYFAFHLTAALMLAMIVYQYYQNKKLQTGPARAFAFLLLSQIIFSLLFLTSHIYVIAEIFQLFGFLLLLQTYLKLVKHNG